MERFLFDLGLSWTVSKAMPYILFVILGLLIFFLLKKIKWYWRAILLPIPFAIYFIFNPIYQGDFSNNHRNIKSEQDALFDEGNFYVIAIPGCPFCYESIDDLNKLIERTKVKELEFFVYTNDTSSLDWYKEKAGSSIAVSLLPTGNDRIVEITKASFPTFIYRKGDELFVWNNDSFGVRAKDWVEEELIKKGS